MRGWIGVDLDGTLAEYHGWKGIDHIGDPIPMMLNRVKGWLDEGKNVKIMTARVGRSTGRDVPAARSHIQDWTEKHLGVRLEVTNEKDMGMIALYDDRAIQVIENTGVLVLAP